MPHIRWMIRRDMTEVMAIIQENKIALTEAEILHMLRQRNCIGMVAEIGEAVVGFMIYILHKDHLEITQFAVGCRHHRKGIGTAMLTKLVYKLSQRRQFLSIHVHDGNLAAQIFLRKCSCRAVEILREYYGDGDAYLFRHEGPKEYALTKLHWGRVQDVHNPRENQ